MITYNVKKYRKKILPHVFGRGISFCGTKGTSLTIEGIIVYFKGEPYEYLVIMK